MKISIGAQIEEVDRELVLRRRVYPNLVRKGEMRESVAALHIQRLESVRATLEWLQENEIRIKQALAAPNGEASNEAV